MSIRDDRITKSLKGIEELLTPLAEAMSDDSLDEYADVVEDVLKRITNLHYVIQHNDLFEEEVK